MVPLYSVTLTDSVELPDDGSHIQNWEARENIAYSESVKRVWLIVKRIEKEVRR